jgi:hypothetical protein
LLNRAAGTFGLMGSNPRVLVDAAPVLTANIVGGWANVTPRPPPPRAPRGRGRCRGLGLGL